MLLDQADYATGSVTLSSVSLTLSLIEATHLLARRLIFYTYSVRLNFVE